MILLLGGAGFIGSHMGLLLRQAGEPYVVFDNLERGHRQALQPGAPFVLGDLRDPKSLERVFAEFPVSLVMHFAAYIEVGESVHDPSKFYWNNLNGVLILLDTMRRHGVDKLVFSSTAAIYGEPNYVPVDESHPKNPTNPYGDTKLAVERMLAAYDVAYGLRSVCLRYFNAAGADPEGRLGQDHRPGTHLIFRTVLAALGKTPSIKVFGNDYDTPDGTCIRDYIHVMDLADAHLLAIRHLREGGGSGAYNLGNGRGHSVLEVIRAVEKVAGRPIPVEITERRPGDPARLVASSELAQTQLGWQPRRAELEQIVEDAYRWRVRYPEGYLP